MRQVLKIQANVRDIRLIVGPLTVGAPQNEHDKAGWLLNCTEDELVDAAMPILQAVAAQVATVIAEHPRIVVYESNDPAGTVLQIPVRLDVDMWQREDVDIDVVDGPMSEDDA